MTPPSLLSPYGSLSLASLLLLATAIDAWRDGRRPLWLRFLGRVVIFAVLTWLMQLAVGSPLAPQFHASLPGEYVWVQLAEIGWWMVGARVAVGILRLVVVLENRPRETQIVSDLLAGAIYVEGEMPEALFLLTAGTVELTRGEGAGRQAVLRSSPGDSIGMLALITGRPALLTATALTPVTAYSLGKADIAKVLRTHPGLATSLEAQAKRGQGWLRCEIAAHENEQIEKPGMLLSGLRQFLQRLST
jgi:hypothetical protein